MQDLPGLPITIWMIFTRKKIHRLKGFSLSLVDPTIFNGNNWAYSYIFANRKFTDQAEYELKIYDGEKTINQYFSYNKRNDAYYFKPEQISFFPTNDPGILLFTRPYNYGIYKLTKDSTALLYKLILPFENSLSKAFLIIRSAPRTILTYTGNRTEVLYGRSMVFTNCSNISSSR